ncbi:MAG: hypothetical protein R3F19_18360 [Verrucomicrobiales bacterium]
MASLGGTILRGDIGLTAVRDDEIGYDVACLVPHESRSCALGDFVDFHPKTSSLAADRAGGDENDGRGHLVYQINRRLFVRPDVAARSDNPGAAWEAGLAASTLRY